MYSKIHIRNSFYHVLLFCYFKHAYHIYCAALGNELNKLSYGDLSSQKRVFENIFTKVRGNKYGEPSFLNEIFIILNLNYSYPVQIDLTPEEKFWFEYVIHIDANKIKTNFENFSKERGLVRLFGNIKDDFTEDIIQKFNTVEAVEYLRKKFVIGEKIENTPHNQGWAINGTSGVAYRL